MHSKNVTDKRICTEGILENFRADPFVVTRASGTQSKAVFSYAMTVMDNICGFEICSMCVWIYTKQVEEYLKRRMMSRMLCMNWVCAGTFNDHEWVSESRIAQHAQELKVWNWSTIYVFRVWYNGERYGSPRRRKSKRCERI